MHAPYAAQYCVIGGSGAGSGGSLTLDAALASSALATVVSEAPVLAPAVAVVAVVAVVADAAVAAVAVVPALVALAGFPAFAAEAAAVVAAVASGADAADGMLALDGAAVKLLGGKGGRDGVPVDEVLVAAGLRGGNCDSCAMLTLVCLFAAA